MGNLGPFESYQYIAVQCTHNHIKETISALDYTKVLNMCADKKKKSFLSLLLGNATLQNSVTEFFKPVFILSVVPLFFLLQFEVLVIFSVFWGYQPMTLFLCAFFPVCLFKSITVSVEFLERVWVVVMWCSLC